MSNQIIIKVNWKLYACKELPSSININTSQYMDIDKFHDDILKKLKSINEVLKEIIELT